jgi:hypothetical protein
VTVGLVVVLVAVATTGIVLIPNFQPLRAGSQLGPPLGVDATALQIDWLDAPSNSWTYQVPVRSGLTFRYRFSIWNHGPLPITITRIGVPASEQDGGLTMVPVAVYPDLSQVPLGGKWQWQPVHPLALDARQMAGVEMQVTLASCVTGVRWNQVPVTFEVLGIERHVFAPLNTQIDLVGPASNC